MNGKNIEVVDQTRLLGTILTSDLKFHKNTNALVKKANARMQLLRVLVSFKAPISDLLQIYKSYIRSILEQSSTVWQSMLTQEDRENLEILF